MTQADIVLLAVKSTDTEATDVAAAAIPSPHEKSRLNLIQ